MEAGLATERKPPSPAHFLLILYLGILFYPNHFDALLSAQENVLVELGLEKT